MFVVADTEKLTQDEIITHDQAQELKIRSRDTMVKLAINMILCIGILSATGGLIFWLASPLSVTICGLIFLGSGLLILSKGGELFRMFGNAAALIGSGMMIGGAGIELVDKYPDIAGPIMLIGGIIIAAITGYRYKTKLLTTRFVAGAIFLMGVALHLCGLYWLIEQHNISGLSISITHLYSAAVIAFAGWFVNVRTLTALSIVPFAQALNTGTFYWHAVYAFYSPESTLSILQMAALIIAALWLAKRAAEYTARHARVISVMAFIVANLCALVGSLWGDHIGQTIWGPGLRYSKSAFDNYEGWNAAIVAFRENALFISGDMYAVLWAVALVIIIILAAHKNNRGLFNTAMTFAGIHAYTQMFENFGDEPLAWVIGGLAAIPLAWGLWRLNQWITNRQTSNGPLLNG